MIITECKAFGLTFDDIILQGKERMSQVCGTHLPNMPDANRSDDIIHNTCGVKGCFNEPISGVIFDDPE